MLYRMLEHFHGFWNREDSSWAGFVIQLSCRIGTEAAMGKAYSLDLRERVIAAVDTGTGAYAAAPMFRVSVSYIYKALGRRRATGEVTARRSGGGPKPKLAAHDEAIRARIVAEPDITLSELLAWLAAERKVEVSIGCLWNRLRFLKLPLKKSRSEPPSSIVRMSPRRARSGVQANLT
jgi:transposase